MNDLIIVANIILDCDDIEAKIKQIQCLSSFATK